MTAPSWTWAAWDGRIDFVRESNTFFNKSRRGCLKDVQYTETFRDPQRSVHNHGLLELSGILFPSRRSIKSLESDPS